MEGDSLWQSRKKDIVNIVEKNIQKAECFVIWHHVRKEKSDWIDLRSAIDFQLKKGEFMLVPLGVAMELPKGYEAHVVPRSSTFKTWGVLQTNSIGIIDESYCGDNDIWKMPVYATRDTVIHKNDRICQFRIVRNQPSLFFLTVENLNNKDRGGIGSTGTR